MMVRDEVPVRRALVRVPMTIIKFWSVQALVDFLDCALSRTILIKTEAILVSDIHFFGCLERNSSICHEGALLVNRSCKFVLRVEVLRVPTAVHYDHGQMVVLRLRVVCLHDHLLALDALWEIVLGKIALRAILRHFLLLSTTILLHHCRIYLLHQRVRHHVAPLLLNWRLLPHTSCVLVGGKVVADLLGVRMLSVVVRVKGRRMLVFTEVCGALGLPFAVLSKRQRLGVLADQGELERCLTAGRLSLRRGASLGGLLVRQLLGRELGF